mmetsp:Transcript_113208/g.207926  ORF Transcript_113208/g.207926 Transcript_113208/m.207926 type:complete len:208 (-) Transcript_113208:221-844(-)
MRCFHPRMDGQHLDLLVTAEPLKKRASRPRSGCQHLACPTSAEPLKMKTAHLMTAGQHLALSIRARQLQDLPASARQQPCAKSNRLQSCFLRDCAMDLKMKGRKPATRDCCQVRAPSCLPVNVGSAKRSNFLFAATAHFLNAQASFSTLTRASQAHPSLKPAVLVWNAYRDSALLPLHSAREPTSVCGKQDPLFFPLPLLRLAASQF